MVPFSQRAGDGARPGGVLSLVRSGLAFAAVVVLLVALVAACGGGDDDDDDGVVAVMSTFTPTPPGFTPEALQTRSARETEFAQESTSQANTTPTAPSSSSSSPASGTPLSGTPLPTPKEGEIRPPDAILRTGRGDLLGIVGDSNYLDPVSGAGAQIDAPYVPLQADALSWATGVAAQINVPNSPYPVGSATVELYTYDDNVALPQSAQGVPTGEIAFYAQTDPVQRQEIQGPNLSITPEVAPGDYILAVRIEWAASPEIIAQFGEQFTQYIYVVKVE